MYTASHSLQIPNVFELLNKRNAHPPPQFFFLSVGYDVSYYNYLWIREPHSDTELHLDNHDVHISMFNFTAVKEDHHFPGLGVKLKLKRHIGK